MSNVLLIVMTLFWSGIVLTFDGVWIGTTYQQVATCRYSPVTGKVSHSAVQSHRSSKGRLSYSAEITYVYTVNARVMTGRRIRFNEAFSSSYAAAAALVNAHPAGATVTVYYRSSRPEEAVLSPGLQGVDFVLILFLTPFNAITLGFWIALAGWLRERLFHPVAGGVKLVTDGPRTRVQLPTISACWYGLATTGGLGFLSIFAVGIGTQMQPSLAVITVVIAIVYGAGWAVYLWQRYKINSGINDLVIDESTQTLQLPQAFGRKECQTVSFKDIEAIWVEDYVHVSRKGGISYTYAPTLQRKRQYPLVCQLASWSDRLKADDFTRWLRKKIGAPGQ